MSAWTMMLCCSLRYFFSLLMTGPTSLLCLTVGCLVRTRCPSHRWRVESSPARTAVRIMLTADYLILISCLPSPHIPAPVLFYIHRQADQERIKSVCLYFNKITQLFYHQRRLRSSWSHQSDGCQMWRKMIWKYSVDWLSFIKSRSGGILMR